MSQKPSMWNNNNPVEFQDPSGYDPYIIFGPTKAQGFGHLKMVLLDTQAVRADVSKISMREQLQKPKAARMPDHIPNFRRIGCRGVDCACDGAADRSPRGRRELGARRRIRSERDGDASFSTVV
jgi:hypothetical protein